MAPKQPDASQAAGLATSSEEMGTLQGACAHHMGTGIKIPDEQLCRTDESVFSSTWDGQGQDEQGLLRIPRLATSDACIHGLVYS